jgi:hypothetical protein
LFFPSVFDPGARYSVDPRRRRRRKEEEDDLCVCV